eukprot:m.299808 g.299808  ORF g.299808 m.299808 type:complete len:291 (-) comp15874_c0_seq3:3004-3876(-)
MIAVLFVSKNLQLPPSPSPSTTIMTINTTTCDSYFYQSFFCFLLNISVRLAYLRTVLEKVRPMDRKLKYQIDKLVRIAMEQERTAQQQQETKQRTSASASTSTDATLDPLQFRPNPANLVARGSEHAESTEDAVYQPPKIAATPYLEDDSAAAKRERQLERERRHMLSSTMMKELRKEVSIQPEEVFEEEASGIAHLRGRKNTHEQKERQVYEEDNFVRLSVSKKKGKRKNPRSALDDVADFAGYKGFSRAAESLTTDVAKQSISTQMKGAKRGHVKSRVLRKKRGKSSN